MSENRDHGPDWSDWGIDHPEEGPSCKCGYNGTPEECATERDNGSTATPPRPPWIRPDACFGTPPRPPWVRSDACFGHCDPEGWHVPCTDREVGSAER